MKSIDARLYGAAYLTLKATEKIIGDARSALADHTKPDMIGYGLENYVGMAGSAAGALAVDQAIATVEKAYLPKPLRGLATMAGATLGLGALQHYFGAHMGVEETADMFSSTLQVTKEYGSALYTLVTDPHGTHPGYLAGAVVTAKAGFRWVRSIGSSLTDKVNEQAERRE